MIKIEKEIFGKKITIETAKVAKQANGAVIVRCEESMVLVTACLGADKDAGFFPLTVDYIEKTYAAGKIPGGYFKREGRQSEGELLTSRFIDRPCRPLFPEGFQNEVQIIATVLSADPKAGTDMLALLGASAALTISDIPFNGPIAGVRVVRNNGKLICAPTLKETSSPDLDFIVAGSKDAIVMVEGGAQQVPEKEVLEAIFYAHKELQVLIELQSELQAKAGKKKIEFVPKTIDATFKKQVETEITSKLKAAVTIKDKSERGTAISEIKTNCIASVLTENDSEYEVKLKTLNQIFEETLYNTVRGIAFKEKKRIDGRDFTTVRPIDIEIGYLPRTHGSALFTRGETQAIVTTTLGLESEAQYMDSLVVTDERKRFMLHYNFPPFCVGETRPLRGPGRREIGHGALAERALKAVLPTEKEFPYVVRIVSEITESNGSSSMASVCGGSLSLMDGGVPIKAAVAGVAMGLMKEGNDYVILTDILGDEDHLGDMDFKVCGSEKGVTALQMDIKIAGLNQEIMTKALEQARVARLHILDKMKATIAEPKNNLSTYAPKIEVLKINPDKIRDLIGPGGKMIRSISESHGVKIDVEQNGTVKVAGSDPDGLKAALKIIESLTVEAEVGKVYNGVVKRIADFGAFVEILPGVDGLVHISELSNERVRRVRDIVNEGEELVVKVIEKDPGTGKIRLSHKEAVRN